MNTTTLCGINFYTATYENCLRELERKITLDTPTLVVTPNPEMLYEASRDTELSHVLKNANIALPDGAGIFVAYQIAASKLPTVIKYLGTPYWCARAIIHDASLTKRYGERITGSRLTKDLLTYAAHTGIPVTIIDPVVSGDSPGDIAKRVSQDSIKSTLTQKYPNLILEVIISDTAPESLPKYGIVFATHGNGRQEKLLAELVKKFPHCGIALGIGGSIDLITGFRSSAPRFFQRFGGEWLYRLYKQPKKHYKRMKKVIAFLFDRI